MAAIGIGLMWVGYTVGLYGYCLLRGYNVTPKDLFSQSWPTSNKAAAPTPNPADSQSPNGFPNVPNRGYANVPHNAQGYPL